MRIAALAFGVVAGLIASLILALGGLDVSAGAAASPDRQIQITRFGLFILANIGVFGAGLVLASPLGGAILFIVGAVAWVVAALLLRHGPDLVLILPPALLLVATIFSMLAFFRRTRGFSLPPLGLGRRKAALEPEEFDDLPPVPVGAGFFGNGGTGQPLRNSGDPSVGGLDERDRPPVDWTPGKRRAPPPRQKPMFRPPEDEYDESGFSRIARGVSSVLSFGLYAGVAAALLLVFWNARAFDKSHPAAATLEPAAVAVASAPALLPASSTPPPATTAIAGAKAAPAPAADSAPSIPPQLMAGVVVADPNAPVSFEAPRDILDTALAPQTKTTASTDSGAASEPPADGAAGFGSDQSFVMPFPMPSEIAAARTSPSSRPPRAAAAAPADNTGL